MICELIHENQDLDKITEEILIRKFLVFRKEFFGRTRQYYAYQRKFARKHLKWCEWVDIDEFENEEVLQDEIKKKVADWGNYKEIRDESVGGESLNNDLGKYYGNESYE